jgi:hypothetical protein
MCFLLPNVQRLAIYGGLEQMKGDREKLCRYLGICNLLAGQIVTRFYPLALRPTDEKVKELTLYKEGQQTFRLLSPDTE